MTSVILHRHAVNRCFQAARPARQSHKAFTVAHPIKASVQVVRTASQDAALSTSDEEALATLQLAAVPADGLQDILDVVALTEINDVEELSNQIKSDADDAVLLAEDEVEAYQDFEAATREIIGMIKDDTQLEVGITEEELFNPAESSEDAEEIDFTAELSMDDSFVDDEDVADDDEDDTDVNVEKILDMIDTLQDKYEIAEAVQDALDAAALKKPEQSEYDESDAFFADAMPFLEEEVVEYAMPEFKLNFLWMDKNIGVSVDQIYAKGERSPLTEYFWWPRRDAWEDLRASLDARPWISDRDKVILLNRTTEVINYWQDEEEKHTIEQAREGFADCSFMGQDK